MKFLQRVGKQMVFFVFVIVATFLMAVSQVVLADNKVDPDCASSSGEVNLTIAAGSTNSHVELPLENCIHPQVFLTAGSVYSNPPIVTNAWLHQGRVVVNAFLLQTHPYPVNVTIWWQVETNYTD